MKSALHIDSNHEVLAQGLSQLGYAHTFDYSSSAEEILQGWKGYTGLVVRSRFSINADFIDRAHGLKWIGRVGAGLENIDVAYAQSKGIAVIAAPEGNRTAVGEHALGMLLAMTNKLCAADRSVRQGIWDREGHRGFEIAGKTIGIVGYGVMGHAFAQVLRGFDCQVICTDIKPGLTDAWAEQLPLAEFLSRVDVLSLHLPQAPDTDHWLNAERIDQIAKPFWLINTGRGKTVDTQAVLDALDQGKILGAGLDVLEFEPSSFEGLFPGKSSHPTLARLVKHPKVLLSPHVGGWSAESHVKLAQTIVDKVAHWEKLQG